MYHLVLQNSPLQYYKRLIVSLSILFIKDKRWTYVNRLLCLAPIPADKEVTIACKLIRERDKQKKPNSTPANQPTDKPAPHTTSNAVGDCDAAINAPKDPFFKPLKQGLAKQPQLQQMLQTVVTYKWGCRSERPGNTSNNQEISKLLQKMLTTTHYGLLMDDLDYQTQHRRLCDHIRDPFLSNYPNDTIHHLTIDNIKAVMRIALQESNWNILVYLGKNKPAALKTLLIPEDEFSDIFTNPISRDMLGHLLLKAQPRLLKPLLAIPKTKSAPSSILVEKLNELSYWLVAYRYTPLDKEKPNACLPYLAHCPTYYWLLRICFYNPTLVVKHLLTHDITLAFLPLLAFFVFLYILTSYKINEEPILPNPIETLLTDEYLDDDIIADDTTTPNDNDSYTFDKQQYKEDKNHMPHTFTSLPKTNYILFLLILLLLCLLGTHFPRTPK